MNRRTPLFAGLAAGSTLVVLATSVHVTLAEPAVGVTPTLLSRGTLAPFNVQSDPRGPLHGFRAQATRPMDLIVRQHDYAPGGTTGWHVHPGPVFITVTKGSLTFYESDDPCTPHVVSAGQTFVDDGHGHMVRNNGTTDAQDISVITAPVGGTFRTNIDPPAVSC
ncbi:MAG: cupin domain-containing protein [Actinomycetota bacterium]|nr:cupin domain-containing protein [Actinomycetota bacterium]